MYFFIGNNSILVVFIENIIFLQNIFQKIPDAVLFILQNFYQESFLHEFHIHYCFHNIQKDVEKTKSMTLGGKYYLCSAQ